MFWFFYPSCKKALRCLRTQGRCAALLACGVLACGGSGEGGDLPSVGVEDSAAGTLEGLEILKVALYTPETPGLHLVEGLHVVTDKRTRLSVTLTPDDGGSPDVWDFENWSSSHDVPVMGLRFGVSYVLAVRVESKSGVVAECDPCGQVASASPPEMWPNLHVEVSQPERMEPGWTLLSFNTFSRNLGSYLGVLDAEGRFVWVLEVTGQGHDVRVNADGNLLALLDHAFVEVDFWGSERGRWSSQSSAMVGVGVDVPRFHHEAAVMESGHFLGLVDDEVFTDTFPTNYEDSTLREPALVMSHAVVEFDRAGEVLHRVGLWDVLDRERISFDSLEQVRDTGALDWIHANAVLEVPGEEAYLVSLRHQDAVVKISRTGELLWILGNHDNWSTAFEAALLTPTPGTEWAYHPHAPAVSSDGQRVLLFDNGNHRISPFTGATQPDFDSQYSRLVEYSVDEEARTVEQTWSFHGPGKGSLFSYAVGDADYLPRTGHVLGTYGFLTVVNGEEHETRGVGTASVRVIEVDPKTQDVVFDVTLDAPLPNLPGGWHGYRAERIDTFGQKRATVPPD